MKFKKPTIKIIYSIIFYTDQSLRLKLGCTNNRIKRRLIWYSILIIDPLNQSIIRRLIDHFGWPNATEVGTKAGLCAYYVIMHSKKRIIEKYIRVLADAVKRGEAECLHLATMIDRLLKYRQKKQIYGNAIRGLKIEDKLQFFIYPIVNMQKVNQRRINIGIKETIEEYAARNNAILNYDESISIRLTQYPSN